MEYGDYQCPYCGAAYPIAKPIQRRFGDNLCFVFRNFPLAQIHPYAGVAAEAAEAAAAQNKFWEMHDYLYENQDALTPQLIAGARLLDVERFTDDPSPACLRGTRSRGYSERCAGWRKWNADFLH